MSTLRFCLFVVSTLACITLVLSKCPCSSPSLCDVITTVRKKEVFIFSLINNKNSWSRYDWSKITSVVMVGYISPELMCYAHKHEVRAVIMGNYPTANLTDASARAIYIKERLTTVTTNYLDGINFDYEGAIPMNRTDLKLGYSELVLETTQKFKQHNPNLQITVDVAWSPNCIDQRCYNYELLSRASDFLFVMAYDEQSQIYGDCVAGANSGYNKTKTGIESFLNLGVPSYKLVLGVPWYGRKYQCLSITQENKCSIRPVPFRGVNCSDAGASEIIYSTIMKQYLPYASSGKIWDNTTLSPYFNYVNKPTNAVYQIWYDDPESLGYKYKLAGDLSLRGVGMWNADAVDYRTDPEGHKAMWTALPGHSKL